MIRCGAYDSRGVDLMLLQERLARFARRERIADRQHGVTRDWTPAREFFAEIDEISAAHHALFQTDDLTQLGRQKGQHLSDDIPQRQKLLQKNHTAAPLGALQLLGGRECLRSNLAVGDDRNLRICIAPAFYSLQGVRTCVKTVNQRRGGTAFAVTYRGRL